MSNALTIKQNWKTAFKDKLLAGEDMKTEISIRASEVWEYFRNKGE